MGSLEVTRQPRLYYQKTASELSKGIRNINIQKELKRLPQDIVPQVSFHELPPELQRKLKDYNKQNHWGGIVNTIAVLSLTGGIVGAPIAGVYGIGSAGPGCGAYSLGGITGAGAGCCFTVLLKCLTIIITDCLAGETFYRDFDRPRKRNIVTSALLKECIFNRTERPLGIAGIEPLSIIPPDGDHDEIPSIRH